MKRVSLISSGGCDPFQADLGLIKSYLKNNKYSLCSKTGKADCIIVHTCAFSKQMEDESVRLLEDALQKKRPEAQVILTGCLPSINEARCNRIFKGPKVSAARLDELDSILNPKIALREIACIDTAAIRSHRKSCYFLRVGWGCLGKCSYCAVKFVFPKLKSRPVADIAHELDGAYISGYRRFYLTGQDVGAYGRDGRGSLADLLGILCAEHADCTFPLLNITPSLLKGLLPQLTGFLRSGKIPFMVIPIQSGSDRILRLMKRPYTSDEIKELIVKIKEYNPGIAIKTEIIIGFPSETKQDFLDTLKLAAWLGRYKVRIQRFVYSDRPGTEAVKMPDKIDGKTIAYRLKQLNKVLKINRMLERKKFLAHRHP